MNDFRYGEPRLFEAFLKSAQYLVGINNRQDVWDHLGKLIAAHFPAEWTAFAQMDPKDGISVIYSTLPDEAAARLTRDEAAKDLITDVLESGFLALKVISTSVHSMTAALPISSDKQPKMVLLIGHRPEETVSKELLNIYLAVAGLAGASFQRLNNEEELNRYRARLEDLVLERTTELNKAKRQNELILHSVGEGILGMDLDGCITFVNPSAAQLVGWDQEELIGRNGHETLHHTRLDGSPYPADECPAHGALKKGDVIKGTGEEFFRRNGSRFPVEFTATPILEDGRVVGAVEAFRDITERRDAQQKILKLNDDLRHHVLQLKAANKELEAFSYSVSHDLRAPLRAIDGFSQALAEDYADRLDDQGHDYISRVRAAAQRMAQLIDDLLKLSRLTRGEMKPVEVDLSSMAREVASELLSANPKRTISFNIADGLMARGDSSLLKVVLENLLGNAFKFTEKNPTATIELGAEEIEGRTTYFVRDDGAGFDMAYAEKLFDTFQRLHSTKEFAGTGIGLALVRRIVHRHGGNVWAEGEVGRGATFFFSLQCYNIIEASRGSPRGIVSNRE